MLVNPFWFGFLIAIVTLLILTLILAYVKSREEDDEEEYLPTKEELREAREEFIGKKFRVVEKNGYLVGEEIKDEEESDDVEDK